MKWWPYSAYKPSGVEWLGEVPEHWEIRRLKHSAGFINQKVDGNQSDLPYTGLEHIESWTGKRIAPNGEVSSEGQANLYMRGDVLFGKLRPYLAKVHAAGADGICTGELLVLRPKAVRQKFLLDYLLNRDVISIVDSSTYGAKMPRANWDFIGNLPVLIPPPDEQRAIASFLDRETGKIDTLVAKKQTLIERLKEKRTALISRTVTRGLPPDEARKAGLDPQPRLKPSGIDWLGEVPEHWEVKAIKRESPIMRGASPRPIDSDIYFDEQGEYAWVRIADVTAAGMYLRETRQRLSDLGQSLSVPLQPGKVFLSIAGSVGKPCITAIKCCIHDGFVYFPFWHGEVRFLYYLFASGEPYKGLGKLGTQLNLNTDTVGSIVAGFPSPAEQTAIADFLDRETAKIDKLIAKIETALERLREYRTALITAAVTGKIDVREGTA